MTIAIHQIAKRCNTLNVNIYYINNYSENKCFCINRKNLSSSPLFVSVIGGTLLKQSEAGKNQSTHLYVFL